MSLKCRLSAKNKPNAYEITEFIITETTKIFVAVKKLWEVVESEAREQHFEFLDNIKNTYLENYHKKVMITWYSTESFDINLGILQAKNAERNNKLIEIYRRQLRNYQGKPMIIERMPINDYENMPIFVENVFKIPKSK